MSQLALTFELHQRENNPLSQAFLEENRGLLTESCFNVLKTLVNGTELTTDNAKELAGTRSLPRRILDLRAMGISISESWVLIDGRRSHKKWFMTAEDKCLSLQVILNKMRKVA